MSCVGRVTAPPCIPVGMKRSDLSPHSGSPRSTPDIIDLLPADEVDSRERLLHWLRASAWIFVGVVAGLIFLRLGMALVIGSKISAAMERTGTVAGWDSSITDWLKTTASVGMGVGLVGLVARVLAGLFWPFGRGRAHSWKPMLALIGISGVGTILPVGIQSVRGVDATGQPAVMVEVDPESVVWFSPAGDALVFYADHLDGQRRFWNREGHTPLDRVASLPVDPQVRMEWERERDRREQAAAARKVEEERQVAAALAEEQRKREEEARQRAHEARLAEIHARIDRLNEEQESRSDQQPTAPECLREWEPTRQGTSSVSMAAPRLPVEPSVPPVPRAPVSVLPLRQGAVLNVQVRGDRVEIWSDGPVSASADHFAFQTLSQPGRPLRFNRGAGTVHVRPLNPSATRVYIRKVDP